MLGHGQEVKQDDKTCELNEYVTQTSSLAQNNIDISSKHIPQGPCEQSQYVSSYHLHNDLCPGQSNIYNHCAANDQSQYAPQTNPQTTINYNIHHRQSLDLSDIFQGDGADSVNNQSSFHSVDTDYSTEDEAYADREPAVLIPAPHQHGPGQPLVLEVDESGRMALPSSLPLIMVTNSVTGGQGGAQVAPVL